MHAARGTATGTHGIQTALQHLFPGLICSRQVHSLAFSHRLKRAPLGKSKQCEVGIMHVCFSSWRKSERKHALEALISASSEDGA